MVSNFIEFLTYEKRFSKHTIKAYKTDLNQFHIYLKEHYSDVNIINVQPKQIRNWAVNLIKEGSSQKSVNRKLVTLRTFFKFLIQKGKCSLNPASNIKSLKEIKSLPNFIPQKDILDFIENYEFEKSFEGYRDKLIFELFYGTGIRLSELLTLRISDINCNSSEIRVMGKGNKQRIIPIPKPILTIISSYFGYRKSLDIKNNNDILILTKKGKKAYPMLIQRIIKKYLMNLSKQNKISPHILRHTYATHLLDKGADISSIKELLGHANLSTTQVYTHVSIERLKKVMKDTHPRG